MKIKCNKCKGTGLISLGKGIRGIKKCEECNGTGIVGYIKKQKTSNDFKNQLIGQREGLQYALDIAKMNVSTLENMIKVVDENIGKLDD